jgi:hypothetical protein
MPGRPVAQRVWNNSTGTGTSDWAYFGTGYRVVSTYVTSTSTEEVIYTVEASAGASTNVTAIKAAVTSTGDTHSISTASAVFDKARINVSANATTGDALQIWLIAGN